MTGWITDLVESMGYAGIALLMFLENIFPPIPSELIMPMAGFAASEGRLDIIAVLASGLAGTLAGALFWYSVGRWMSEERLRRWADHHGRWITLSDDDIRDLEDRFCRHRLWAVPVAHVIPGLRTLISIPAGIFEMPIARFLGLTALGAGLWTSVLGIAGYWLGREFEAIERYLGPVSTAIMTAMLAYYLWRVVRFKAAA
jgi:membrane protein DedA with SNARE-associated domain